MTPTEEKKIQDYIDSIDDPIDRHIAKTYLPLAKALAGVEANVDQLIAMCEDNRNQ